MNNQLKISDLIKLKSSTKVAHQNAHRDNLGAVAKMDQTISRMQQSQRVTLLRTDYLE